MDGDAGASPCPDKAVTAPFEERLAEFVILGCIAFVSLTGNLSLWIIVLGDPRLRTVSNWIVLCLSGADVVVSAVVMPFVMFNLWNGRWTLSAWSCVLLGFVCMTSFVGSVMSLAAISWNRYMFICHLSRCRSLYTKTKTLIMIAGIWIISVLLALPPVFGWGKYNYLPTQSICFCEWKTSISYTIFMVVICFGGPFSIMAFCYSRIVHEIRSSKQRLRNSSEETGHKCISWMSISRRLARKGSSHDAEERKDSIGIQQPLAVPCIATLIRSGEACSYSANEESLPSVEIPSLLAKSEKETTKNNVVCVNENEQRIRSRGVEKNKSEAKTNEEMKLTRTFLVVILTFVFLWLPFSVMIFISVFDENQVPRTPNMITLILGCLNSCCNPIIYGVMNKRFKRGYARLYCSLCRNHKMKVDPFQTNDASMKL